MNKLLIFDYGSQYTHLISKRFRKLGYYTEICQPDIDLQLISANGIILSGGPGSTNTNNDLNIDIFDLNIPILGICYGHQLIASYFKGTVKSNTNVEFGKANLIKCEDSLLFKRLPNSFQVWMSHHDTITSLPEQFKVIGKTETPSAIEHKHKKIYSLQFHPEVNDTDFGSIILDNFAKICNIENNWNTKNFTESSIKNIKEEVKDRNVLMFLSGGVDSSVAFSLLNKSLGSERVLGLFIDNGFLRTNEAKIILEKYNSLGYDNIIFRDYSIKFLEAIKNITDPEEKRKSVGETFLKVREEFLDELNLNTDDWLLGQGTLYPDIIESGGSKNSHVIKSHHNRVDAVKKYIDKGLIIEPLKELYKDEVRILGALLGLPKQIVQRHPFPGPGLSINVICSDSISEQTSEFLPIKSVGVQGDQRTYKSPKVIHNKADWDTLEKLSIEHTNKTDGSNRVVLYLPKSEIKHNGWIRKIAYCTKERLNILRKAETIVSESLEKNNWMIKLFQVLVILLPISEDGKKESIVIRPVVSEDVMTAQFAKIDWDVIEEIVDKLYKIPNIDSVFYDITHKPPATFGWE